MILIDSLYINNSGGKTLLDYLVQELEKTDLVIFYLFDARCNNDYKFISKERKLFLKASIFNRYRFYKKNKKRFSKVFCFGNLPPLIRFKNAEVYTYFHQTLFLSTPSNSSFAFKITLKFKTLFLRLFKKNTNLWFVQSEYIKAALVRKYGESFDKVEVLPFYPPIDTTSNNLYTYREKNTFIYVSSDNPHKNHVRLIEAFCLFYDKYQTGKLILTVHSKHSEIYNLIENKINNGYPINNLGFINREQLIEKYLSSEYLIFPSLTESFGLGIIEAIECGCKVIGTNLPYLYEVCKPSLTFNPFSVEGIQEAFYKAVNNEVFETEQRIYDQVDKLIKHLRE